MGTTTSDFGISGRESHDASSYYSRNLYGRKSNQQDSKKEFVRNVPTPGQKLDTIFLGSAEKMNDIEDGIVDLVVTSPPYNVGKEYDEDLTLDEYVELLHTVFEECYRTLQSGGRLAINVANVGRKPYIALTSYVDAICTAELGFLPRAQIVWQKADGANGSCAWGSFGSASNPVIRDVNEYILIYSKDTYGRPDKGSSTITKEAFLRDTLSIWKMQPESAKRIGHPAPFPVDLPYRLIQLYTYQGDIVLDPFAGAGTTQLAAAMSGRHYLGYEIEAKYIQLANERITKWEQSSNSLPKGQGNG